MMGRSKRHCRVDKAAERCLFLCSRRLLSIYSSARGGMARRLQCGGAAIAKSPSISISGVIARRPSAPPPSPSTRPIAHRQRVSVHASQSNKSKENRFVIPAKESCFAHGSLLCPPSVPPIMRWAEIRRRRRRRPRRHHTPTSALRLQLQLRLQPLPAHAAQSAGMQPGQGRRAEKPFRGFVPLGRR